MKKINPMFCMMIMMLTVLMSAIVFDVLSHISSFEKTGELSGEFLIRIGVGFFCLLVVADLASKVRRK